MELRRPGKTRPRMFLTIAHGSFRQTQNTSTKFLFFYNTSRCKYIHLKNAFYPDSLSPTPVHHALGGYGHRGAEVHRLGVREGEEGIRPPLQRLQKVS